MSAGPPVTAKLSQLLPSLVDAGATGALHVQGSPGGTFYLVEGRIGYAESAATPGVGQRLMACGRLPEQVWRATYEAGHKDQQVGRLLVEQGHLVHGELVSRVLAATYDAAYAIITGTPAAARFAQGERHWLGLVTVLTYSAVERETARRRLLLRDLPAEPPEATTPVPDVPVAGAASAPPQPIRPTMVVVDDDADGDVARDAAPTVPLRLPAAHADGGGNSDGGQPTLPRRVPARTPNAGPKPDAATGRCGPDYATLKRIRAALKTVT